MADAGLAGTAKMAVEAPRQIANAHTVFNVVNTLIAIPFATQFAKLVVKIVPEKAAGAVEKAKAAYRPKYLDDGMLSTPPLALSMARRETARMGEVVEQMLAATPEGLFAGRVDHMVKVRKQDDQVDILYGEIAKYLARIGRQNLSDDNANEAMSAMTTVTELENVGDIIETNLYHLTEIGSSRNVTFSEKDLATLNQFHALVVNSLHSVMVAYEHDRPATAKSVIQMEKGIIDAMDDWLQKRHEALLEGQPTTAEMDAFTLQSDILENYKRIYLHVKRIARLTLRQEGSTALVSV